MTAVKLPKFRTGDTVKVLTGPDRGKEGKITQVLSRESRAVVDGVNLRSKKIRARRGGQKGEIIQFHAPVNLSNLILMCPHCHKSTRIAMLISNDGKKTRQCKHCSNSLNV